MISRSWSWWLVAIVSAVLIAISGWVVFWYRQLDLKSQAVKVAWETVGTVYSQRFDLIPVIADSSKSIYIPEREVFDYLAQTRQEFALASSTEQQVAAAEHVELALDKVTSTISEYPTLASRDNVVTALQQLESSNAELTVSLESYNAAATQLNQLLAQPGVQKVAQLFNITPAREFSFE